MEPRQGNCVLTSYSSTPASLLAATWVITLARPSSLVLTSTLVASSMRCREGMALREARSRAVLVAT